MNDKAEVFGTAPAPPRDPAAVRFAIARGEPVTAEERRREIELATGAYVEALDRLNQVHLDPLKREHDWIDAKRNVEDWFNRLERAHGRG